jgi:glucan biosynthesis protein C
MKERRYDIDWLRVLVMLAVFFFHCARFFGGGTWHLNNEKESIVALLFIGWLDMWFMPLFCLLSGVGSWYALRSRTNGQYLLERVKRILVPLYTVGLFLLLPPQFYFEIFSNAGYRGAFLEMLPRYFSGLRHFSLDWPGGLLPLSFSGHLWFLQYLFLISLVALPLLRYLRSEQGLRLIDKLAGWCDRRGGIFLFLIPLILVRIVLKSVFWGEHTWADFFEFVVFFVIGYILPADTRFTESLKKHGWICLILGIAGFGGEALYVLGLGYNYPGGEPFSLMFVLFETVMAVGRWSWMVFVLSLGAKYLNFKHKVLAYGNEAVLPFYIFHQTIILCVGWSVIRRNIGILPKYLIIVVVSFVLIMTLYELLVRRFNIVRFFFGMRPKRD